MRVVPTLSGLEPVKSRYVYKRKYNMDGSIKEYMARLVAQVPGVDIFNTFAPVVKSVAVRFLLALVFIVNEKYASSAFSSARIEGDIYVEPTPD